LPLNGDKSLTDTSPNWQLEIYFDSFP